MQVFAFSFRQVQLAKLTPSEVIETAYLSSLLEQQPHTNITSQGFSHRFETLRTFLIEVVRVVPIESLVHAIAVAKEIPVALKCCRQLMVSKLPLAVSITMDQSLVSAIDNLIGVNVNNIIPKRAKRAKNFKKRFLLKKEHNNVNTKHLKENSFVAAQYLENEDNFLAGMYHDYPEVLYLQQTLHHLYMTLCSATNYDDAVCGINLEDAYPTVSDGFAEHPLKSPLQILIKGRENMQRLVKASSQIVIDSDREPKESSKLSQLYNSEMLKKVNEIRKNALAPCTLLLGSFMEEQIRVPLKKTSFDSARAIEIATSAAALGVWALLSLSFGDVKTMINYMPSQSFMVEVTEYIKGFFKQDISTANENYAGKLQFMVQGIGETVGCNSHYVSYSLERQLLELCTNRNIDKSTPLDKLINEWDHIFKDNIMSFVSPPFRGLISRWLKWALMIHHLREELASYSAIGVVGLVNSGKSLLVSTLFNIKVLTDKHHYLV